MSEIEQLIEVMKILRSPDGCPWDREQTHQSLMKNLMEEAAEFLDAAGDHDNNGMLEELGDLLMHIVLHAQIARENGAFTFDDVARLSKEKMIRRHPHVFGSEKIRNSAEVQKLWDSVKSTEQSHADRHSLMDGIPAHCPALLQAEKMQKKAAKVHFDFSSPEDALDKIQEELDELRAACNQKKTEDMEEELGDLLFSVVNFSRLKKMRSAEELLGAANKKFSRRFRLVEAELLRREISWDAADPQLLDGLWEKAKRQDPAD